MNKLRLLAGLMSIALAISAAAGDTASLQVSETSFTEEIMAGQSPAPLSFTIGQSDGAGNVSYSIESSAAWLTVDPAAGQISGSDQDLIELAFDTVELPASNTPYTATITIEGYDEEADAPALNSPWLIDVSLLVKSQPKIGWAPEALTNVTPEGYRAPAQSITIWNDSPEPRVALNFEVRSDTPWISVSPTNGSCLDNSYSLTLDYATESMAMGYYTGQVSVIAHTAERIDIPIDMRITPLPVIGLNFTSLTNSVLAGEDARSQSFTISNASGLPRGILYYNISGDMSWATLSETAGNCIDGTNRITITYDTAALTPGIYEGTFEISGFDATGHPLETELLQIVLLVSGHAQLSTSTDQLQQALPANAVATDTFQLWNGSLSPKNRMFYNIAPNTPWLSVTPNNGAIDDVTNTISVTYNPGAMAPGTYSGTLTIDALDTLSGQRALGAPKTIALTLTILSRAPINYELPEVRGRPYVGQTLSAQPGLWQNQSRLTFAYQWQIANNKRGAGLQNARDAEGRLATGSNYVVRLQDKAKYMRVRITATDPQAMSAATVVYSSFVDTQRIRAAHDDFNGNGLTDLWFFYPPAGLWKAAYDGGQHAALFFGEQTSWPVPGDYDGDGVVDPAVYDQASGLWLALLSGSGYACASAILGGPGYSPVPGDYDGDGLIDPAVYDQASGLWLARISGNAYLIETAMLGGDGYSPVPGDYDGDGKTDPAVYHPETGWWLALISGSAYALDGMQFGGAEFTPVPGDYDGDGKTDLAVYWAPGNRWWLRSSYSGQVRQSSFGTSAGRGIPVPGYYDYDAQCDPATVHLDDDFIVWCVDCSQAGYCGHSYQISQDRWRVHW